MALPVPNDPPRPGLPPVLPPSGRFIAQLFVVPGVLIAAVVLLMLGLSYWTRREREPAYFLQQLDSDNADIRWRGMNDLAQILKRPETAALRWKANARFALDLVERLEMSYRELLREEQKIAAEIAKSGEPHRELAWRKLRHLRDHISFLASALGDFHVPVGAPVLCEILKHETSPDLKGNTVQRRKALWSLMNMGENVKGFARLPPEQQRMVLDALRQEAGQEAGQTASSRALWARTALYYLDRASLSPGGASEVVKVDESLVACARSEDRFLRELVAMAFNFWDGDHAEATLLRLANDDGHGTLVRVEEND